MWGSWWFPAISQLLFASCPVIYLFILLASWSRHVGLHNQHLPKWYRQWHILFLLPSAVSLTCHSPQSVFLKSSSDASDGSASNWHNKHSSDEHAELWLMLREMTSLFIHDCRALWRQRMLWVFPQFSVTMLTSVEWLQIYEHVQLVKTKCIPFYADERAIESVDGVRSSLSWWHIKDHKINGTATSLLVGWSDHGSMVIEQAKMDVPKNLFD